MLQQLLSRLFKKKPQATSSIQKPSIPINGTTPDKPTGFGYKCCWLAVSTADTEKLAEVFGLKEMIPSNWEYGIHYAYEGRFFITPPVDGWSFIVSRALPFAESQQNVEEIKLVLKSLSTAFGQAQYFGTYRVVSYDSWMRAENGQLARAYSIVDGANIIVEGEPTDIEKKYNLVNTLSEEAENDPDYFDRQDLEWPDESMTMEIAGAWSLNPQDLYEKTDPSPRLGLLGF